MKFKVKNNLNTEIDMTIKKVKKWYKKMIKSTWPYHSKEEINQAIKVLKSGKTNYWVGNICKTFEYKFSKYIEEIWYYNCKMAL